MAYIALRNCINKEKEISPSHIKELVKLCNSHDSIHEIQYYSLLMGRTIKLKMSDKLYKQNIFFCYGHIIGLELSVGPSDDEDMISNIESIEFID